MSRQSSAVTVLVRAILALCVLGIVAVTLIVLLAPADVNTQGVMLILGFLVPIITALLAGCIQQLHHTVNGRLDQMIKMFGDLRYEEGQDDQREKDDHDNHN